jgi:hypothetical protein
MYLAVVEERRVDRLRSEEVQLKSGAVSVTI